MGFRSADLLIPAELHARLQAVGDNYYHHRHPFHLRMHEGLLTRGQLQAWALNRYYYQSRIPMKDSIILSRSADPEFRRAWRKRIVDHDGDRAGEGGIERWIQLAEATGLDRERVVAGREILPDALRGRCILESGFARHAAGSRRIFVDRTVLRPPDRFADGCVAQALCMARTGSTVLLAVCLDQGTLFVLDIAAQTAQAAEAPRDAAAFLALLGESLRRRVVRLPEVLTNSAFELDNRSLEVRAIHELITLRNDLMHVSEEADVADFKEWETIELPTPQITNRWLFVGLEEVRKYFAAVKLYIKTYIPVSKAICKGKIVIRR